MDRTTQTAPARIWLQIDPDTYESTDEPFPQNHEDVSWCAESIGGLEVEYVRADLDRAGAGYGHGIIEELYNIIRRVYELESEIASVRRDHEQLLLFLLNKQPNIEVSHSDGRLVFREGCGICQGDCPTKKECEALEAEMRTHDKVR